MSQPSNSQPEVHGQAPNTPPNTPNGENAGSAIQSGNSGASDPGVEDATVKEIKDSSDARSNPDGDSGTSPWIGIVEDLLKAGGKELWSVTKDYVKRGDLSLFKRRNPSPQTGEEQTDAPEVPSPDSFKATSGHTEEGSEGGAGVRPVKAGSKAPSSRENSSNDPSSGADGPSPNPSAPDVTLNPGDLARVEVGNSVVWVRVTGTAGGADDFEGRLAHSALGLSENAPVTFARRHLLGRVGEAPEDPTPEVPEGIVGKRVRDNPEDNDGPLPPRF